MEFIRAIVKKYSREYNRTLKNGKKKKYQTEQVQITVPKEDNIFENDEIVLIIPSKYMNEIERSSDEINKWKLKNNKLNEDNDSLKSTIEKNNDTIYNIKTNIEKLNVENSSLKKKLKKYEAKTNNQEQENCIFSGKPADLDKIKILDKNKDLNRLNQENKDLKKDKENLKEKIEFLDSYIKDLKYSIKTLQYSQKKEVSILKEEYDKLKQECENLKQESKNKELALKKAKQSATYHENISKKLKEFILKSY